jgi:hypothetical protein
VPTAALAAAASRPSAGFNPLVSIPGSTKKVSASTAETTGATVNGSNQITLADASSFAAGHGLSVGAVARLVVTGPATLSGQLRIRVHSFDYMVDVVAGDSAQTVAGKIAATAMRGANGAPTDTGSGWEVVFRTKTRTAAPWIEYYWADPNGTGVTFAAIGAVGVEVLFDGQLFEVVSKSGNVVTLSGAASASWAGLLVVHDDKPALADMCAAISTGTKLTLPANLTCRCEAGGGIGLSQSQVTLDANNLKIDLWGYAQGWGVGAAYADIYGVVPITAGKTKESTQVQVPSSAGYSVGDMVTLIFGNDPALPVIDVAGYGATATRSDQFKRCAVVEVTGVPDGTHLQFDPPLFDDFSGVVGYVSAAMPQVRQTGLENLWVDFTNCRSPFMASFYQANECWGHNLRLTNGKSFMLGVTLCRRTQLRKLFLDRVPGVGTNKWGISLSQCTNCLVEDSIIYKVAPFVEMGTASAGNAFVYNTIIYSEDDAESGAGADFNYHYAGCSHNLFSHNWINGAFHLAPAHRAQPLRREQRLAARAGRGALCDPAEAVHPPRLHRGQPVSLVALVAVGRARHALWRPQHRQPRQQRRHGHGQQLA